MTRYFSLLVAPVIVLVLSLPNTVKGCIPVGGVEPPCSAYWKADAVFVGVVSDITKVPHEPKEVFDKLLLHFSVEQPYRGVESTEVEVTTITGTECDTKFQKGERWLVYARRNSATDRLEIWARTNQYTRASEDLSYIRGLSAGLYESSITVKVFDYPYTPLRGVRIEIEGNGEKYKGDTDKDGGFRVPTVDPARYLIRGLFPARTGITGDRRPYKIEESEKYTLVEYQEVIKDGRCLYIEILVISPRRSSDRVRVTSRKVS